jgi:hypothetical protein
MIDEKTLPKRKIAILIQDDMGKGTSMNINVVGYNPTEAIGHLEVIKTIMINNSIKDGTTQMEMRGKIDDEGEN